MSDPAAPRLSRWLIGALVFAALYWTLDLVVLRSGVPHPLDDTWDDGLVARALLAGQGLRSRMIYPPLWSLRDPATQTVPLLVHGPLLPLLLALPIRVLGPSLIDHAAWLAAACALLTIVPLYRLGARHAGPPVGAAAAGLYTVSPLTLTAVHHGLSVALGALLLTWALDLVARDRPRAGAAGVVLGLGYLVRPEFLVAAIVLGAMAAARPAGAPLGARIRAAATLLIGVAACGAWWWWHHWRAVGSPIFNLTTYTMIGLTETRSGTSPMRDFALTPDRWPAVLRAALPELAGKWQHTFPRALGRLLGAPSWSTGWLGPIGLAVALWGAATRRAAVAVAVLAMIPVAMMILATREPLYMVPVLPLLTVGVAMGAQWLFGRLPTWAHRPRAWVGALALLMLPVTGPTLRETAAEARLLERWLALERAGLPRLAAAPDGARRPVFSDTPDFVAWETGRPAIWMLREEYEALYRGAGAASRPRDLPAAPGADDVWFHADPRDPAKNLGVERR
jgi:hypothetical protein